MFDWARGRVLQDLTDARIWRPEWGPRSREWLKDWTTAWFLATVDFRSGLKLLDVGSAQPLVAQVLHDTYGCETHAMDAPPDQTTTAHFGLKAAHQREYPDVTMHYGLAGQDLLESESFDLVLTISAIEHTYDKRSPMAPEAPLAHVEALRDMCRMLKPGGLLLFNWDTYLDGVEFHYGWDYLADLRLLLDCGMALADPRHPPVGAHSICNDPDTLFFAPSVVANFSSSQMPHGVAINAILVKPGAPPRAGVRSLRFGESLPAHSSATVSTHEMEARFRAYAAYARQTLSSEI